MDLGVEVAARIGLAEPRHPLAPQPEDPSVLRAGRHGEGERPVVRGGDANLAAQDERRDRCPDVGVEVVAASLEPGIRLDLQDEVQVARLAPTLAGLPLPGDPDPGTGSNAGRGS
jgi:hypothetical protein